MPFLARENPAGREAETRRSPAYAKRLQCPRDSIEQQADPMPGRTRQPDRAFLHAVAVHETLQNSAPAGRLYISRFL
ncbi:hypothetical protein D3C78_1356340 [compost metagenome]